MVLLLLLFMCSAARVSFYLCQLPRCVVSLVVSLYVALSFWCDNMQAICRFELVCATLRHVIFLEIDRNQTTPRDRILWKITLHSKRKQSVTIRGRQYHLLFVDLLIFFSASFLFFIQIFFFFSVDIVNGNRLSILMVFIDLMFVCSYCNATFFNFIFSTVKIVWFVCVNDEVWSTKNQIQFSLLAIRCLLTLKQMLTSILL